MCLFSKGVGVRDSNETEVLAILEALRIFSESFQGSMIVDNDSFNTISWVHHFILTKVICGRFSFSLTRSRLWHLILMWSFFLKLGRSMG